MVQIFADVSSMQDGLLAIGGSDYNHIKNVLRMHPGEKLSVRGGDSSGEEYLFERERIVWTLLVRLSRRRRYKMWKASAKQKLSKNIKTVFICEICGS